MNAEQIREWIRDPSRLNRETMLGLRAVTEEYPCFTAARILYLKNLLKLNDLHYPSELNRTGISVPDRRRLFYFMEGKPVPEFLERIPEAVSDAGDFSLIDRFLQGVSPVDAAEDDSYFSRMQDETTSATETDNRPEQQSSPQDPEQQNSPVAETNATTRSISGIEAAAPRDFLNLQDKEISVRNDSRPVSAPAGEKARDEHFALNYVEFLSMQPDIVPIVSEPMKGQDLIDDFLSREDTWSRVRKAPEQPVVQAESSTGDSDPDMLKLDEMMAGLDIPEDSFTDALARIYLKQKRYDRALEIFRSLSLKYPEKSVYFADQIRFLEKLIIHIKK